MQMREETDPKMHLAYCLAYVAFLRVHRWTSLVKFKSIDFAGLRDVQDLTNFRHVCCMPVNADAHLKKRCIIDSEM